MIFPATEPFVGRSLDLYAEYAELALSLLRACVRPGQTVLDVGANVGAHSVALARQVGPTGSVFAFEPRRGLFHALCGNVALNNLDQVACYHALAGDKAGTIAASEIERASDAGHTASEVIPVMRIDDLPLPGCQLLRIALDGREDRVLAGALQTIRRCRPVLYLESRRNEWPLELLARLAELGYDAYLHRPPLFNPSNFAGKTENVFERLTLSNLYAHPSEIPSPVQADSYGLERVTLPARAAGQVATASAAPASFDEARREHQAGNAERAVPLYRQYLLVEPNNAQAWYLLGAALTQLGQLDEARSSLRQATSANPRHAEAHNHLGVVLAQQASLDEAITSFRRALELKPDNSEILNNLGLALLRQDKANEAIAIFQRALEVRPDDVKARHNLNRALREQGHFEELLTSQRQAVGQQPESAQAHNDLGLTLYEQGKLD